MVVTEITKTSRIRKERPIGQETMGRTPLGRRPKKAKGMEESRQVGKAAFPIERMERMAPHVCSFCPNYDDLF